MIYKIFIIKNKILQIQIITNIKISFYEFCKALYSTLTIFDFEQVYLQYLTRQASYSVHRDFILSFNLESWHFLIKDHLFETLQTSSLDLHIF